MSTVAKEVSGDVVHGRMLQFTSVFVVHEEEKSLNMRTKI